MENGLTSDVKLRWRENDVARTGEVDNLASVPHSRSLRGATNILSCDICVRKALQNAAGVYTSTGTHCFDGDLDSSPPLYHFDLAGCGSESAPEIVVPRGGPDRKLRYLGISADGADD